MVEDARFHSQQSCTRGKETHAIFLVASSCAHKHCSVGSLQHYHTSSCAAFLAYLLSAIDICTPAVSLTVQPFPAAGSSTNAGLKCGRSIRESDGALSLPSLVSPSSLNLAGMCSDNTVRCCDRWILNSVSRTVRRDQQAHAQVSQEAKSVREITY